MDVNKVVVPYLAAGQHTIDNTSMEITGLLPQNQTEEMSCGYDALKVYINNEDFNLKKM